MSDHSVMKAGAAGALIAAVMLIALAVLPWSFDFDFPGEEVLTGQITLSPSDFEEYVDDLQRIFIVDTLLIIGWAVSWIGLSVLIRTRHQLIGNLALVLGLIGPALDFTENGMVWALVAAQKHGVAPSVGGYIAWKVVLQLSYVITYTAAAVVAMGLWSRNLLDRIVCIVGTVGLVGAVIDLYAPTMSPLVTGLWWLGWFVSSALLLWKRSHEAIA